MKSLPMFETARNQLAALLQKIEDYTEADCIFINSDIGFGYARFINDLISELAEDENHKDRLVVILTTTGGQVEEVDRTVNVFRNFYKEVYFIVPDYAFSAGTVMCMSGDEIYMDYFSVLGPIDPQVQNKDHSKWIPAQGYLDKVAEFVEKSTRGELSEMEFMMIKDIDLADLRFYEQARELNIDLLKKWLVKYKFKNWVKHSSTGLDVTPEEKEERARWIAAKLSDNNVWKSHSRGIDFYALRDELKLVIVDYGKDAVLSDLIKEHYRLALDYMRNNNFISFFQTRRCL